MKLQKDAKQKSECQEPGRANSRAAPHFDGRIGRILIDFINQSPVARILYPTHYALFHPHTTT